MIAGVLERFPRHLEEHALLRIHHRGLAGRVAEERGIERVGVANQRCSLDVVRAAQQLRIDAGGEQLGVLEERDGLVPGAEVAPQGGRRVGPGQTTGHPHDGDRRTVRRVAQGIRQCSRRAAARRRLTASSAAGSGWA
jgi:hypothetical protein